MNKDQIVLLKLVAPPAAFCRPDVYETILDAHKALFCTGSAYCTRDKYGLHGGWDKLSGLWIEMPEALMESRVKENNEQ